MIQERTAISQHLTEILIVVTLFVVALTLRTYQLQTFPPGLYTDEAAYGLDALAVLDGDLQVFFPRNNGREPLFIYMLAAVFHIVGATPYTIRLTAALCGAVTVVTTYWMVQQQFAFQRTSYTRSARWYAVWTALFLMFSYWHICFSRLGFRAITLPLTTTVAFGLMWFTWRRVHMQQNVPWGASMGTGVALGLCLYTYTAGRMAFPLFLAIATAALAFGPRAGLDRRRLGWSIAVSVGSAVFIMLPLAIYFLTQPTAFGAHAAYVSVFNPQFSGTHGPFGTAIDSTRKMLLMFITMPDPNLRHNPGQIPVFDPLLAIWLALGLGISVSYWRHLPLLFSFLWFGLFLLPAALTAEGVPHSLRAIGMLPIVYLLPVIAMDYATKFVSSGGSFLRWLPLPFLIVATCTGAGAYYNAINQSDRFASSFFVGFWDLAQSLRNEPDDTAAWILPLPPGEDLTDYRLYTAEFALRDPTALAVVRLEETSLAEDLTQITSHKRVVNVLDTYAEPKLRTYDTRFMDPKGLLDLILRKNTNGPITEHTRMGIPFRSYPLTDKPDFTLRGGQEIPIETSFDNSVRLESVRIGILSSPGGTIDISDSESEEGEAALRIGNDQSMWLALHWQAGPAKPHGTKASLILRRDSGEFAGQTDIFLADDRAPRHPDWLPGESANSYATVSPIPALPPGSYTLWLQVYNEETGEVFPVNSVTTTGNMLSVATIEITAPITPGATIEPSIALQDAELTSDFTVIGADIDAPAYLSGDTVSLTVYFHAKKPADIDLVIRVALQDANGQVLQEMQKKAGGNAFPTSSWRKDEVLRDWFRLPLEATMPSGVYTLTVTAEEALGTTPSTSAPISLGQIEIINRPHILTLPAVTYPLTVTFENTIRMVGVTTDGTPELSAGAVYTATIIWQPLRRPTESLVRFVQLLDANGTLVAQEDTTPCAGQCPSTSWLPDEYLFDEFRIEAPTTLAPGPYQLIVGWYERSSLERLRMFTENGDEVAARVFVLPLPSTYTN